MATKGTDPWADFEGFKLPQSNTTYTPNQFFDLVLRDAKTTGIVRAVAYVLRKTLGWSNPDGSPQETDIITDYRHLMAEAGISRAKIRESLDVCLAKNYLTCIRKAQPDQHGKRSVSALYCLAWDDDGEYTKDPEQFSGFFAGEGNRTYIPNQFFDLVIPNENLSVIKVIGAIIRHTIGFQNRYGHRRQEVSMSVSHLMRVTKMQRQAVRLALKRAFELGCITKIEAGSFDFSSEQANKATTYGLNWENNPSISTAYADSGSQITTEKAGGEKRTGSQITTGQAVHKSPPTGSGITTQAVHKSPPHRNNTEIKPPEITTTQGDSAATAGEGVVVSLDLEFLKEELRKRGVSAKQSEQILKTADPQIVSDQIEAFDFVTESGKDIPNPGGFLRSAIVQDYSFPKGFKTQREKLEDAQAERKKKQAKAQQQQAKIDAEKARRAAELAEEERQSAIAQDYLRLLSASEVKRLEEEAMGAFPISQPELRKAVLYRHVLKLLATQQTAAP